MPQGIRKDVGRCQALLFLVVGVATLLETILDMCGPSESDAFLSQNFLMCEDFIQDPLIPVENSSKAKVSLTNATAIWDPEAKDAEGVSFVFLK